ncbi:MAG: helix-turn-helix transcriptional regulator [Bacteroidaceae bacterium]|nr:helix-turn-helix transcriptional regulator [Bacteroidaceae bacterium]MBO7347116.1 helix-turn-helix transcriptional regulator [Bacteroidaceae bacterium]
MEKTKLSTVVKALRKEYGLTQEDLAMKSGVGLCFVRNLEQGKSTLRMDKVNQLLDLFNYELTATKNNETSRDISKGNPCRCSDRRWR